jgi:hypothetical protein
LVICAFVAHQDIVVSLLIADLLYVENTCKI